MSNDYSWVIEALESGTKVLAGEYFMALSAARRAGDMAALQCLDEWFDEYEDKWPQRYVLMGSLICDKVW